MRDGYVYGTLRIRGHKNKKMDNPKQQLIERIKAANNVLVTVSANPSVDQLSAAIGLTLMLNKMGKHGTAVFSGEVPSTIEFLQPEKTIEKNTDSLRDFIIALDKSKADKLRYKVEDSHVKIFITPYRTSISEKDLVFSQGDFNVEVVVALGVNDQRDLDQAITAHGRILHDATTISLTNGAASTLGSINWADGSASSLCEMVASLAPTFQDNLLDAQMATALMTGIVAETDRFSNEKTSPSTMSLSSTLMSAGANQQLVASKLQEEIQISTSPESSESELPPGDDNADNTKESHDGALQIEHDKQAADNDESDDGQYDDSAPQGSDEEVPADNTDQPQEDTEGNTSSLVLEPPSLGGKLTANTEPEHLDPAIDPLGAKDYTRPLLSRNEPQSVSTDAPSDDQNVTSTASPEEPIDNPLTTPTFDLPSELPEISDAPAVPEDASQANDLPAVPTQDEQFDQNAPSQTLSDLEAAVHRVYDEPPTQPASTVDSQMMPPVDEARDAVSNALGNGSMPLPPIEGLGTRPLDLEITQTGETGELNNPDQVTGVTGAEFTMPENLVPPVGMPNDSTATTVNDPTAPPTVPPPFMPGMPGFDPGVTPVSPDDDPQEPPAPTQNPFNLPPA